MSLPGNGPFPTRPFGLLLVEGGDEQKLCKAVAGPTVWSGLVCWKASGRAALPTLAKLALLDPSFDHARSVGVLLDMEDDLAETHALIERIRAALNVTTPFVHGAFVPGAAPKVGIFVSPDGQQTGSIDGLCKQAVRNPALASCVDTLVACAGQPHTTQARGMKGWLDAYLAMQPEPLRLHQALDNSKVFDLNHAAFTPLRAFLQAL
ncbi:hypothetical protein HRD49_09235 [Corallococcus exiguus]|uniref:DUF3226 domain-containing protein n=1 Tax=Corallococcus TaxID=83461 RepID=UPI000EA0176E|nr:MULTISPECIES: DUF3226 domain-containing protein [Corallococcus]NNC17161.1 hypothetical protein [Corallococcus exiguus]NRD61940.1 hypothetical protein [Corallococcus exiguus]RKH25948.1 hypothetical protein D7V77_16160 [Corallococcus sp. CA041A]RKI07186.1 hypothetical protein D7Y15_28775 [Corallococcus sp. AB030]